MDAQRQPTLQTIADAAGVSRMTVSYALRNDPRLAEATRRRIQELARRLDYRPNPHIAVLMSHLRATRPAKVRATLAFLTTAYPPGSWRNYPYTGEIIQGAIDHARELGYQLDEFCLEEPGMTGDRLSDILAARGIRGLLIGKQLHPGADLALRWERFSCVALGYSVRSPMLHRVCTDCIQAVTLAANELRRRGYRRVGYVTLDDLEERNDHLHAAGFLLSQQPVPAAARVPLLCLAARDKAVFAQWLQRHRPDAVLSFDPQVRGWLQELGGRVPDDVAYVNLIKMGAMGDCAHVAQPGKVIGASAVDLMVGQFHRNETGVPTHPKTVLIQGTWVDGASVQPRPR